MFKRIVFNQFHDLTRQGKDPMKARINAIMMLSVLIILPLFILFFLNINWVASTFRGVAESGLGPKLVGKIAGAVLLLVIFGGIYLLLGNKARFGRYWEEFSSLDDEQRKIESRKGSLYFLVPFFVMMVLILYLAYLGA